MSNSAMSLGERAAAKGRATILAERERMTFDEALAQHQAPAASPGARPSSIFSGFADWMEEREPGFKARQAQEKAEKAVAWRCGAGKRPRRLPPPHSVILLMRRTRVFLSACHLDHDPTNNATANLAALCQRCHLMYDAPEHRRRRAVKVLARRAVGDLFGGPYSD